MRRILNSLIFFTFLILFTSCSKDNPEFIVGQWQVIERFDNGNEIDLTQCDPFIIREFGNDGSLRSFIINENDIPSGVICGITPSNLFTWEKEDENNYIARHSTNALLSINYRIEGNHLFARFYPGLFSATYSRR